MCGIFGAFESSLPVADGLEDILSILAHRGPDEVGTTKKEKYILGHTRLSIVDVQKGHQPLCDSEEKLYVIANGEIYNHEQWRELLKEKYNFLTESDTEILLPLYEKFGTQLPEKLKGMFSFILAKEEEFFVARDRLGIKPLYYAETDRGLFFASEIKALLEYSEQIQAFPPGHYYHSKEGLQPYYRLREGEIFLEDLEIVLEKNPPRAV